MSGKKNLKPVRKILLIRNGALGDLIVTLPVIYNLKKVFPAADIALMGNPYFLKLVQNQVTTIIPNDVSGLYTLFRPEGEFPENIKSLFRDVDLVISYTPDPDHIFIQNLEKIKVPWVIQGGGSPMEKLLTPITDFLLSPLAREGISVFFEPPKIVTSFFDKIFAEKFFRSSLYGDRSYLPVLAVHPGSGSRKKCWPREKFVKLMRWAKGRLGTLILLISGPADKDIVKAMLPEIKDYNPLLAEDLPLTHLAAVLEKCTLYVGNDSGITHLAASVGTPTLALFGPTDFRIWGPRNEKVKSLSGIYPCSPCSSKQMAECPYQACLTSLPIATVRKALFNLSSRFCSPVLISKRGRFLKEKEKHV